MYRILWAFSFLTFFPHHCMANSYDLYRADYTKGAFCSAVGGACAADTDPENSFFQNPASLASGRPDVTYDADLNFSGNLEPGMKGSNDVTENTAMAGFGWSGKRWGWGVSLIGTLDNVASQATITSDPSTGAAFVSKDVNLTTHHTAIRWVIPVAYRVTKRTSIGASLIGLLNFQTIEAKGYTKGNTSSLNSIPSVGFQLGVLTLVNPHLRLGAWFRTPLNSYVHEDITFTALGSIYNYHEDMGLKEPWILSTGAAFYPWKDKRTLLADLDLIGTTTNGFQLTYDNFSSGLNDKPLREKGRALTLEPHLGWRSPWFAGSLGTYLMGTYLEVSRLNGISSRLHFTTGISYQFFHIAEVLIGVDVSREFFQTLITFR